MFDFLLINVVTVGFGCGVGYGVLDEQTNGQTQMLSILSLYITIISIIIVIIIV